MKISRSAGYALLAVGYISQNQKKDKCVFSQDISKKYKIPLEYLLKIMQQMVKVGILRSKRGPRGGFNIGRASSQITFLNIIEAIDGPIVDGLLAFEDIKKKDKFMNKVETAYSKVIESQVKVMKEANLSSLLA
ncbi:hypothetical protein LCGC14_0934910 [marine sediment metagenome]|uniref:Rrf2 family transcriptional regulator n=1 Tax=marine sediment metagenome TaxID=412755 RepID=A0A0F9NRB9_9ZZZZ